MKLNHAEISGFQAATFPPSVGIVMTIVVDVHNPNGYDVAIRSLQGNVIMADKYTLPLNFQPGGNGLWLPADQTTQVRAPVVVPVDLALTLLREAYMSPVIPFHVVGKANVTGTRTFQIEKDDYEVDERGTVTRQQIEAILPNTVLGAPR